MPGEITHRFHDVNGIRLHVARQGKGPAVVLCHGWPELWYSWRRQIPAVAGAGFRVLAPDMRGFGESSAPPNIEDYSQEQICADLVALLDEQEIEQAIFVGHDWGGIVVWNMATHHPDRVRAVAAVNTPFMPQGPVSFLTMIKANPQQFDYQLYFQEPGVAEAEFEANVRRTFTLLFRSSKPEDGIDALGGTASVRERGGLFVDWPDDAARSVMLSEAELTYFVNRYEQTGFRGGLNWYRNHDRNWEWGKSVAGAKVEQPALMVTAGKDPVLRPSMTEGMEQWVPNLTRAHIEECGHWTQQEAPDELNRILVDWLASLR